MLHYGFNVNSDYFLFSEKAPEILSLIYYYKKFITDSDLSWIVEGIIKVIDKVKKLYKDNIPDVPRINLKEDRPPGIKNIYERISKNADFSRIKESITRFVTRMLELQEPYEYLFLDMKNFGDIFYFLPQNLQGELLVIKSMVEIFGVNRTPEWKELYDKYYISHVKELQVRLANETWFHIFCDIRRFRPTSVIVDVMNNLGFKINNKDLAFLAGKEVCGEVKPNTLDFTEPKIFLLYNDLGICDNYPECRQLFERFYSTVDKAAHELGLFQSSRIRVNIRPMMNIKDIPFEEGIHLFIALDTLDEVPLTKAFIDMFLSNIISSVWNKNKDIVIILLPPSAFGFKTKISRNVIKLLATDEQLETDPQIMTLINKLRDSFENVKVDLMISSYNYVLNYNGRNMSLKDLQIERTKQRMRIGAPLPSPIIPSSSQPSPIKKDLKIGDDFLPGMRKLSAPLLSATEGTVVIVYDQNKHGIEESLARIATEVARFRGHSFDPIYIDETDVSKLATSGVFVFKEEMCDAPQEVKQKLEKALLSLMGYKGTFVIMPKCLYEEFQIVIGGKPKAVLFEDFTKEEISLLAYLASGLTLWYKGFNALGHVNKPLDMLLTKARSWLRMNYIDKDVPSEGNESEDHRNLKAYVIRHLIEKEKVNPNEIYVETYFGDLKPDIFARGTVYEVKSSIGVLPSDEIRDALKYAYITKRIRVVMRPIAVLLDIEGIIGWLNKAAEEGIDVDVLVPAVDENKGEVLISIKELLEKAKNYK